MGYVATVTTKGQMTLPVRLREALGIQAGDRVDLALCEDGSVRLTKRSLSFSDLKGVVTIEGAEGSIENWIEEARADMATRGLK